MTCVRFADAHGHSGWVSARGPIEKQRLACIQQDFRGAGLALGNLAMKNIEPARLEEYDEPLFLITHHNDGVSCLEERIEGLEQAVAARFPDDDVLEGDMNGAGLLKRGWKETGIEPAGAADVIVEAMEDSVIAILCSGQTDLEGAAFAKKDGRIAAHVQLYGFDLSHEIMEGLKDGTVNGTVDQQPYAQGFYPIVQLTLLKRYGLAPSDQDAGSNLVTGADVDAVEALCKQGYR